MCNQSLFRAGFLFACKVIVGETQTNKIETQRNEIETQEEWIETEQNKEWKGRRN